MTTYIGRSGWGARPPKNTTARDPTVIESYVFHYADATAHPDLADEERAVRSIQNYHMDHNGWADIAYHAIVGMSGTVYQGRPIQVVGAHCLNYNTPSLGVCFLTDGPFSLASGAAAVDWCHLAEFLSLHRRPRVFGHWEKVATGCPGAPLKLWVANVRAPGGVLAPT